MTEDLSWVPTGVDPTRASIARVYDYWLGGTHNLLVDRDAARAVIAAEPNVRAIARANRDFLGRAVRFLAGAGIRQFLDIGSGIPTQGSVHQVAQSRTLESRVVYVDIDPVAVAHSKAILTGNADAAVVQADLRDPEKILADPAVRGLIDFAEPAAVLLAAVLHFIPDGEDPWGIVGRLCEALAPGSYLVISHACGDSRPDTAQRLQKLYTSRVAASAAIRTREAITRFFDGLELVAPGVVDLTEWRPDPMGRPPADRVEIWGGMCGVGRKPPSA